MKIGSAYEYTTSPWTMRPGKIIPASTVRFTVLEFDRMKQEYGVLFGNGSKNSFMVGSPMHRGSVEVAQ